MSGSHDWSAPPLSPDDQALIEAYLRTGLSLDSLPYTSEFETLCRSRGIADDDMAGKRAIFSRLLTLRKQGRLPRAIEFAV